jgi:hypothetical protein
VSGGRRNLLVAILLLDHDLVGWQWAGVGLGVHASDNVVEHFLSDPGVHYVRTKLWLLKECKSSEGVHGVARGAECQLVDQILMIAAEGGSIRTSGAWHIRACASTRDRRRSLRSAHRQGPLNVRESSGRRDWPSIERTAR